MKKKTHKNEDFEFRLDTSGQITWSNGPNTFFRASRINNLLQKVLHSTEYSCPELALLLFDGVCPKSLAEIIEQESAAFVLEGVVQIEWKCTSTGALQRRRLSDKTIDSWPTVSAGSMGPCLCPFLPLESGHIVRVLIALGDFPEYCNDQLLDELGRDLCAWWSINLLISIQS